MMVERLFLAVPRGCLQFVIVVFPDHTHLLFSIANSTYDHIERAILHLWKWFNFICEVVSIKKNNF